MINPPAQRTAATSEQVWSISMSLKTVTDGTITSKASAGVAPVGPGIGEERDQREHLHERARPAVGDEERHRRRAPPSHVDQVDADALHLGAELRKRVHRPLLRAPVEGPAPVLDELPHVGEIRPVIPACVLDLVGPP
jgi:hypothetical protein